MRRTEMHTEEGRSDKAEDSDEQEPDTEDCGNPFGEHAFSPFSDGREQFVTRPGAPLVAGDPPATETKVVLIEDYGLPRRHAADGMRERNPRSPAINRRHCGCHIGHA